MKCAKRVTGLNHFAGMLDAKNRKREAEMKKRNLGNSGLEVAPLAFGGNVFGWTVGAATAFQLLDAFVSSGFNLIDTADIYPKWVPGNQGGESETIIGNWLKRSGKRQEVTIATKVGMEMGPNKKGLSKNYIMRSADDSLRRLQTDHIDLYQSHQDDPQTPVAETLEAYDQLIKQGKVRAIGASNYSADQLAEALNTSIYEDELEPLCVREGLGVIPYYSLASGFLTGKYRSEDDLSNSPRGGTVKKYLNERGFRILKALDQVAAQFHSTPARISLAWLIARPSITAPIASATNLDQLNDLIEATKLELDPESIELLNQASAERPVSDKEKSYARTQTS